ncbi:MAG TPA: hypothetical protein DDY92_05865 [Dialister sp.]|nr:hypothetical protein [Dialister sp.]
MDENELEELRRSVGDIDQNLVSLLEKRLQVSQSMAQRQLKAHVPVYDAAREEKIVHDLSELLVHVSQRRDFMKWSQRLMGIGKKVQKAVGDKGPGISS